ncbi:restriction endonuclease subunit S [Solwaraspora sp. WMMA2080]|uniref:restriction endonuclease subunit S n=1 Tax=Solwaraspora sp. WMMA2080 TaxID=3015165 RepID=UPI00248BF93D|nr:restriction endonuclease subunit S [Solwaraspora sp. WMMA2080]WBC23434.1 restriction endonuclease subunit S [Solwaraspora sp. WMMA2080]
MSDLPPGWELAPLSEIVAINQRRFDAEPDDDEHISFVPMASVEAESGQLDASQTAPYGELKQRSLTRFQEGDVLFAKVTPCMENGKIAVARGLSSGRGMGSTELFSLRSHGAIDPDYLAYYLLQDSVRRDAARAMTGAVGLRRVPRGYLENLAIPVPPLAEQRRMIGSLETLLSHCDVAVANVTSSGARLKMLTKRVLVESVPITGRPGWRVVTVGQAGKVDLGRQRHPDWHTGPHMRPYLRVANVFEDRLDLRDVMQMDFPPEVFERFRLTPGDILLNEGQSPEYLGRPAMYRGEPAEMAFTNSLLRFRAHDGIDPEWALLVFRRHMHARRFIKEVRITTNIAHLSASRFKEVEFPVPPIEEQRAIVAQTKDRLDALARLADSVQLAKVRAGRLREALLAEAFAGRLVEQDPADEPASELLARIRAQRVVVPKQRGRRTAKELAAPATRAIGTDFQQGELPL